ncbi:MAG: hypothetical protein ACLPQS_02805 [Acidimicrobiales bacterium]
MGAPDLGRWERPKDEIDAREVIPHLAIDRRQRLAALLPSDHAWQVLLSA